MAGRWGFEWAFTGRMSLQGLRWPGGPFISPTRGQKWPQQGPTGTTQTASTQMILLPIIFYMICTWWSLVGPCFWIIIFIMYVFSRVLNEDSSCGHNFLDGIASPSPSTYPCQSVGESVIDSFRLEIAIASPSFASLFQTMFSSLSLCTLIGLGSWWIRRQPKS